MSKSDLVDIACKIVARREKAIAVVDGTLETVGDKINAGRAREKWFWLPLSQIEIDEDAGTVTMPEWLAQEKGLI